MVEQAIDRLSANAHFVGDGRRSETGRLERADSLSVDGRLATFVDAIGFGLRDTLGLALAPDIGFKSGRPPFGEVTVS